MWKCVLVLVVCDDEAASRLLLLMRYESRCCCWHLIANGFLCLCVFPLLWRPRCCSHSIQFNFSSWLLNAKQFGRSNSKPRRRSELNYSRITPINNLRTLAAWTKWQAPIKRVFGVNFCFDTYKEFSTWSAHITPPICLLYTRRDVFLGHQTRPQRKIRIISVVLRRKKNIH